ncbi:gdp-l-fucose synthase 1 [Quercus suber]|uniref:Gdp-l-fucose synthase 1 n=1 Tax=Quercus suber TaxID=58331 RepID=A0AAW0LFG1_QUESU
MMESYSGLGHMNVGSGKEVSIKELAELVKDVVGFEGSLFGTSPSLMGLLGSSWIARSLLHWVGPLRFRLGMALLIPISGTCRMWSNDFRSTLVLRVTCFFLTEMRSLESLQSTHPLQSSLAKASTQQLASRTLKDSTIVDNSIRLEKIHNFCTEFNFYLFNQVDWLEPVYPQTPSLLEYLEVSVHNSSLRKSMPMMILS